MKNKNLKEICRFNIAGVQYSDYQLCLSAKVGRPVKLIGEPSNKFDSNAIRIECDGVKLGYVPKGELQDMLWEMHEEGNKIFGQLTSVNKTNPTWNMFVVACSVRNKQQKTRTETVL